MITTQTQAQLDVEQDTGLDNHNYDVDLDDGVNIDEPAAVRIAWMLGHDFGAGRRWDRVRVSE